MKGKHSCAHKLLLRSGTLTLQHGDALKMTSDAKLQAAVYLLSVSGMNDKRRAKVREEQLLGRGCYTVCTTWHGRADCERAGQVGPPDSA